MALKKNSLRTNNQGLIFCFSSAFVEHSLIFLLSNHCERSIPMLFHPTTFPFQAFAILNDFVTKDDPTTRIGAIMGLGIAYAGSQKEEVGD